MYEPEDVVVTTDNEIMTYEECKKYYGTVIRKATKKETEDFWEERNYWQRQISEQQRDAHYHELPE